MSRAWVLLLALLPLWASAAGRPRIVVLKSAELAAYASVIAGFTAEADAEIEQVLLPANPDAAAKLVARVKERAPALVLAVGPAAANAGRSGLGGIPLLFAMVPYYERYGLEGQTVTGIALTNDFTPELAALKAALPGVRRVGVVHDPRYSAAQLQQLQAAAQGRGLAVVPLPADGAEAVPKVLAASGGRVDALVMVSDRTVGSAQVVHALIRGATEARLPLVALSSTQVQEGALLSLAPSYLGLGQQAGRLANRLVHEKVDPGAVAVARPEALELSINLTTARALGQAGAVAEGLLSHAARQGLTLKVYE